MSGKPSYRRHHGQMPLRNPSPLRDGGSGNTRRLGDTLDHQAPAENFIENWIAGHSRDISTGNRPESIGWPPDYLSGHQISEVQTQAVHIGDRIKLARRAAGLTQVQLAERLGVDKSAVAQWEAPNSRKGITLKNLIEVAKILGVSVASLTGDGNYTETLVVADPPEVALVRLFRQMTRRQKDVHLQLFYTSVGMTEPSETQGDPTERKRITR